MAYAPGGSETCVCTKAAKSDEYGKFEQLSQSKTERMMNAGCRYTKLRRMTRQNTQQTPSTREQVCSEEGDAGTNTWCHPDRIQERLKSKSSNVGGKIHRINFARRRNGKDMTLDITLGIVQTSTISFGESTLVLQTQSLEWCFFISHEKFKGS